MFFLRSGEDQMQLKLVKYDETVEIEEIRDEKDPTRIKELRRVPGSEKCTLELELPNGQVMKVSVTQEELESKFYPALDFKFCRDREAEFEAALPGIGVRVDQEGLDVLEGSFRYIFTKGFTTVIALAPRFLNESSGYTIQVSNRVLGSTQDSEVVEGPGFDTLLARVKELLV